MKLNAILLTFLFTGLLFGQETRTITMKSGDKITGQVVEETDTTLTIINPLMGQMVINKSDLKERVISITLKSGDKIGGTLVSRSATEIVVATAFGNVSIPADQVETIDDESSSIPTIRHTPFGTAIVSKSTGSDEWFFSNERLMDIWFDPTGYTIGKNKLYMSGLSWGLGLTDKVQVTSRWTSYFVNDFNIRPKVTFFKDGTIESETAAAAGIHMHTRGLPGKYKWVDDGYEDYNGDGKTRGKYVRLGSTKDENGYYNDGFGEGDQMWFELFGAYTISKLRTGGDGRMNTTFGASAVMYPGEDIAPRLFAAFDTDVTQSVKVMAEIFYDAYYPEIQNFDGDSKMASSLHFDIGFLTNRITFSDDFWVGFHFQRPFISFYWKI
jgi:RNase P/RNase MRP subunit p29